ncbi:hypothetical protein EDF77_2661 [Stenotrophomonas maltophilia]|uniref:hypothetical protein n=1 Tax=Stenotrophomonas chelatiphaga TaxID=517011 RepID=UPI000FAF0212|nr:hypothetical protein [Stenotrophomonas chelatiphaga]MCS4230396.1 hypothetical protein [Stenotrophomonas chelatiphaga]ROQ40326.1 hypothetical protein EDF77_2661 [Stenotrophomonas maltophilia]
MNIYNLTRPLLVGYCFLFVPLYVWASFFGYAPYVFMSVLLLAALIFHATISHLLSGRALSSSIAIPRNSTFTAAIAAISLITFSILLYYAGGDRVDYAGRSMFTTNFGLVLNYIAWLGIGISIARGIALSQDHMCRALGATWLISTLFFVTQIDSATGGISFSSEVSEKKSMYLLFADFYAVSALMLMGLTRSVKTSLLVAIISAALLFFLESRASLFFFLATACLYYLLSKSAGNKALAGLTLLVSVALLTTVDFTQYESAGRMTVFFERGLQADASFIGRVKLLTDGIGDTLESPILGAYNSLVEKNNNVTAYIHNILSYWQLYGLPVFLLMSFLLVYKPATFIRRNLLRRTISGIDPAVRLTSLMCLFVLLQVITARAYVWHFSWLLIGLISVVGHERSVPSPRASSADDERSGLG